MTQPDPAASFRNVLSAHGFGFQYAVLEAVASLVGRIDGADWCFEAAEVPVDLGGKDIHIDFVLKRFGVYIIGECKRVDPALARWCLARTAFHVRTRSDPEVRLELLTDRAAPPGTPRCRVVSRTIGQKPYHVGVEVKHIGARGDGVGSQGALAEAKTQVLRGAGGFARMARDEGYTNGPALVIPVIFTTAQLLVTETPLENADLATGTMPDLQVHSPGWAWLQHNATRSLLSADPSDFVDHHTGKPTLSHSIRDKRMRSVAIVTVDAIERFFRAVEADWEA